MIELEILVAGQWKPARRYDNAHGFAHRDRLNLKGEIIKERLPLSDEQALTLGQVDLNRNWEQYRESFLREEFA
ncbi:hypothetical protein LM602_08065 [Candidatus Acetothermia bacterium]|nr:hypothetical protein [Candidatus Acetothermia bacterium]MCI2432485.1 hypothetical protein [Candidatus Acetothermia bacterium]MCI2436333.1 hypothetical protein [Candidatus Acetothermia bacterium]